MSTVEAPRLVENKPVTTSRKVAAFVVPGFSFKLEKDTERMAMQRWLHDDHLLEKAHFVCVNGDIKRAFGSSFI